MTIGGVQKPGGKYKFCIAPCIGHFHGQYSVSTWHEEQAV